MVTNHHRPDASRSPTLNGNAPHLYYSYFETRSGEQSLFAYNWETRQTVWVRMPASCLIQWSTDAFPALKLTEEELIRLCACWQATSGLSKRRRRSAQESLADGLGHSRSGGFLLAIAHRLSLFWPGLAFPVIVSTISRCFSSQLWAIPISSAIHLSPSKPNLAVSMALGL